MPLPDVRALSCLFLGLFVLAFGLTSRILKESLFLSEPLLSTLLGVLLSPKVFNILHFFPQDWDQGFAQDAARESLAWFCRIVIGIQVLFAASTIPSRWLLRRESVRSMAVMLGPVMTVGWLVSSGLVRAALPRTTWTEALIIGACIAPTDPVLANSVVKGIYAERHIPRHVRELLIAESGLNDGFGTPFLFIPVLAVHHAFNPLPTTRDFILHIILYDVLLGSLLGVALGYVARKGLKFARRRDMIDRESMLVFSVALALFTIGVGEVIRTNGLLACFFAGTALNWTDRIRVEDLHSHFSEGVELFFDSAVFLVLGTILPFNTWIDPTFLPLPNLVLLGVLVLVFRRLPVVLALYKITPLIKTKKEGMFTGYFGPIGVGALYYALMATDRLPDDFAARNKIIAATTFIIFCSIIVHGTSAPLIMLVSKIPGRYGGRQPDGGAGTDADGIPGERDALLGDGIPPQGDGNTAGQRITASKHDRRAYSAMGDPEGVQCNRNGNTGGDIGE
ncbi:Cation/H+ exchanger [Gautieria morchelliformis]|nr:Cation/H+ exchanger [Gautieria morchelliformis]